MNSDQWTVQDECRSEHGTHEQGTLSEEGSPDTLLRPSSSDALSLDESVIEFVVTTVEKLGVVLSQSNSWSSWLVRQIIQTGQRHL